VRQHRPNSRPNTPFAISCPGKVTSDYVREGPAYSKMKRQRACDSTYGT
jgi:hypothetical protein